MNICRGLVAEVAILDQALVDDFLQPLRQVGLRLFQRHGGLPQNGMHRHSPGRPGKCLLAGRHLVEQHSEREQVGARVQRLSARLLRRHIRHCAYCRARMRERPGRR